MKVQLFMMIFVAATVACSGANIRSERNARSISDAFIADQYSMRDLSILKVSTRETDNSWTFVYEAPNENWTGGPLFVTVDKKSGKIVDHRGYQ